MSSGTPTAPRGTERILLVDDEVQVRTVVRRMLERLGYRVVEATNGAEAIGLLDTTRDRIDLILTDVVMPELHGGELGQFLHVHEPARPVLYMSGYTGDEITRRGLEASGAALLKKPFTAESLAHAVRELLDRPAGR
jgi:Response regulator containing CheY-like receiver, AAA-type ATPase, and DNA-binding domains